MAVRKYHWEEWFGRPRTILEQGVHYDCSQSTMAQIIRNNASQRGLRVRVVDIGDAIVVDVTGTTGGQSIEILHPGTDTAVAG